MNISELLSTINSFAVFFGISIGLYFLMLWLRDRKEQRKIQERQFDIEREERYRQMKLQEEQIKQAMDSAAQQMSGLGSGGFIVLDLPNEQRALFHDLLKGFEEYAMLKGYKISFSIDSSLSNKIAFKFTLADEGVNISVDKVKKDLKEYIDKVQSGEPLGDLPIVLPKEEHNLIVTTMKNRINFLQHSYNLKKNAVEFYENLLQKISYQNMGIFPTPNIMIQTGGKFDSKNYKAIGSSHLIQGNENEYIDESISTNITIENSFNKRKEQINILEDLIEKIQNDENINSPEKQKAIVNFEKVKDELTEEEKPDKSRIVKWLDKSKEYLKLFKLGKETVESIKALYSSFNLQDIISGLF